MKYEVLKPNKNTIIWSFSNKQSMKSEDKTHYKHVEEDRFEVKKKRSLSRLYNCLYYR